jgi:hypothetical protein
MMANSQAYDSDFDTGTEGSTGGRSEALKQRFSDFSESASGQIDNSPLIALGAGLALGAVLGAVVPASRRERELLEPLGRKINEAGSGAIDRSRTMAKQKFDEMAGDKLREFLGASSSSSNA